VRLSIAVGVCTIIVAMSANAADKDVDKSNVQRPPVDEYVGYFYPDPKSVEIYTAKTVILTGVDRRQRVQFVTDFMNQIVTSNRYPPQFAIFSEGDQSEKMIITSLGVDRYDSLYRMRGLLAILTARARVSELFQRYDVADVLTFLDLLKLLGFEQLVMTDGDEFAHRIVIQKY